MSFSSMGPGGGGRGLPRPLHDFMICFKSFQANWSRATWGRIRSIHSGVRLKIMNRVVSKRIICSDSDILDPKCSKNALLSASIRSHVVVSRNFSFSSARATPFYGVVVAPPRRVGRGTCHWSRHSIPFHSRH